MMIIERRIDEPQISILTRGGATTCSDKANEKKEFESAWVRKTAKEVPIFYIQKEKEVFMEAKWIFMDVGASISSAQPNLDEKINCNISSSST